MEESIGCEFLLATVAQIEAFMFRDSGHPMCVALLDY